MQNRAKMHFHLDSERITGDLPLQGVEAEGVVALGVEPGEGVGQEGLLHGLVQIGVEDYVDEGLEARIGELNSLHQIAHGIRLLQHGIQFQRQAGLSELRLHVLDRILWRFLAYQTEPAGDMHQQFAYLVDFPNEVVFHILLLEIA